MATGRELRQLLRPLLKRRPDLALGRRELFFLPLTHYLRGVAFTAGRWNKRFEAHSIIFQMFDGRWDLGGAGNHRQPRYKVEESWVDDPERTSAELCEHLERRALPLIARIVGPREHEGAPQYMPHYLRGRPRLRSPGYVFAVALGACYLGEFDRAESVLAKVMAPIVEHPPAAATEEFRFDGYVLWRMAYLLRLLRTDRARVPQLLHDWEAFTVNELKLTKYWKPTPFPCDG